MNIYPKGIIANEITIDILYFFMQIFNNFFYKFLFILLHFLNIFFLTIQYQIYINSLLYHFHFISSTSPSYSS